MTKYRIRICDHCNMPLDSNGMCHRDPDCPNYCAEFPQNDDHDDCDDDAVDDEYDRWQDRLLEERIRAMRRKERGVEK